MKTYLATKNLVFPKLDKEVIVGETIELEESYAAEVNKNLKLTFPDVKAVLVPVDGEEVESEPVATEPKKAGRKKTGKADEAEPVADAAE